MFLLEINYKLLWYYVYYAGDGLDYSLVYWSSLGGLSVEGDKNTSGQAVWFLTSDPAHCQGEGGVDLSAVSFLWSEHSALRLATCLSRCFSVNLRHHVLKWDLLACEMVAENWTSAQTCMDSLAYRGPTAVPSQLVCTILYSPSPCVSPPHFLYSNGETLLVYVFDICTNAPLWKNKMKPWHIWNKWAICVFLWVAMHTWTKDLDICTERSYCDFTQCWNWYLL